ncbi:amidohydrolase [Anaerovorax odorimutans]|uniref:Amidohydrolase n=1 Tax=Anaerovorax odorimutans TaxID=109327 RepID=A0ABT1RMV3_9FIRM|nr:amidohydrolase [Anaerovorax odorimutans]MCQ4636520.1 amidohydrolase [Anaerovorax odorimutans]
MENLKEQAIRWIEDNCCRYFEISDALWENPELSMQEHYASGLLTEFLSKEGYAVEKGVAGMPTAFIASYGVEGPVIGFSCEYDALPTLSQDRRKNERCSLIEGAPGHGCGHNLMAIGGAMAAGAVKALIDSGRLKARLKIFGTPAEELCIGKPFMAREGYFENLDCLLDWHPMEYSKAGYTESTAYFNCKYHFTGKTAHGNAPWFGRSALDAAILMSNALEFLREHLLPGKTGGETTLNYNFENVGGTPNVVPEKATLWCVGRMGKAEEIKELKRRVDNCADGIALATETQVTKELITVIHEKIPNEVISKAMQRNFEYVGNPEFSNEDRKSAAEIQERMGVAVTKMGKEPEPFTRTNMPVNDSSEYSWFAPMDIALVELVPDGIGWHNWIVTRFAGSDAGRNTVSTASKILACTAIELIEQPELIDAAKEELHKRLGGRVYESLFDKSIRPATDANRSEMEKYRIFYQK